MKGRGIGRGASVPKWQPTRTAGGSGSPAAAPEPAFDDAGVRERAQQKRTGEQEMSSPASLSSGSPTGRPQFYQSVEGADCLSNIYHNHLTSENYVTGAPLFKARDRDEMSKKCMAVAKQYHQQ